MNPIEGRDTSQLSAVDARKFLLHIFRDSPEVYAVLYDGKLPGTVDYYYYDKIQDMLSGSLNRNSITEQLRLLRWISSTHKAYPHNPEIAMFIGILGLPTVYYRDIMSNKQVYYPTDTEDTVLNESNKHLLEYIDGIRRDPDRYRHQLVLMADRYNEEHQYTGESLKDILLEDYESNYSYDTMKRIENSFTVMSTICRCLGNSNSLIPHNVMLQGHTLTHDEGINSAVYLMNYNSKVPTVMKTITPQISRNVNSNPLDQLHEYLVGLKVNELRKDIANFVYTYGYSRVTNPISISDSDIDMLGLFNSDNHAQLYIQYVDNSSPIYNLSTASLMQVVDTSNRVLPLSVDNGLIDAVNIQVLCAILYAYQKIRFKHNDLNGGNILIVGLNEVTAIPIKVPISYDRQTGDITFATKYMLTDRLVMIIDYGRSSVNFDYTTDIYGGPLLPLAKYFDSYEGTGVERDVLFYLLQIMVGVSYNEQRADEDYTAVKSSILNLIYSIVTGSDLSVYSDSLFNRTQELFRMIGGSHLMTYPSEQYHLVDTLIKYCNKHSTLLHDTTKQYTSILQSPTVTSNDTPLRIDSIPKYYMYRYIPDDTAEIVEDRILNNAEYRRRLALSLYSANPSDDTDLLWTLQTYKNANFIYTTLGQMPSYHPVYQTMDEPYQLLPDEPYITPLNQLATTVAECRQILNA